MAYGEPYSTSKHGLVGFSNSLRKTIRVEGYPLGVSVVCPGFISETGMYADSVDESGVTAPDSLGTSSPETVAAACVEAVERNRAKRVLREAFRTSTADLSGIETLVFIATERTGAVPFADLRRAMIDALREASGRVG